MNRRAAPWLWQDRMFFEDANKRKPDGNVRLRLAEVGNAPLGDATLRHRNARMRRETAGPSLLDRQSDATDLHNGPVARQQEPDLSASITEQIAAIDRRNAELLRKEKAGQADTRTAEPQLQEKAEAGAIEEWNSVRQYQDDSAPLIDPRFVFRAVGNSRSLILATTVLGGLAGIYLALDTPKLYYSSATIVVDPRNYKVIENDLNPDVFLSEAALAIVDSQVSLMRSPRVLEKVSQRLSLSSDPEFNGSGERGVGRFFGFLNGGETQDYTSAALEYLADHMSAERAPKTFVVSVGAYSEDAEKAALIANTIVDVYLEEQSSSRSDTAKRTSGELTARLENLRTDVEKAENAVEAFKSENNLIGAQGRLIEDEEILRVNDQLTAARSTTITLNARAQTAKSVTVDAVASGSLPEEVASTGLTALRSQYVGAKQKADGLAAKLGPRHPDLQQASNEAESLGNAINAEINRIRQSIQTDLKRAVETEQSLAARLAQLKARSSGSGEAQVQLRELEREAASARTVYEQFLLRARETGEQGEINANNVQKISEARASDTPEGASRKLIAMGGVIAGFFAGLGLAIAKGMFDALKSRFNGGFADPKPAPKPSAPRGGSPRSRIRQLFPEKTASFDLALTNPPSPVMAQSAPRQHLPEQPPQAVQPQIQHPAPQPQPFVQPAMQMHPYQPQPFVQQVVPIQPYPQPVQFMQPVYHQPAPMPMQPCVQAYGYPFPPVMPPVYSQPMMMPQPQMAPHQMHAAEQPSPSLRGMRNIRETLDGLHAELAELSRRRRSA